MHVHAETEIYKHKILQQTARVVMVQSSNKLTYRYFKIGKHIPITYVVTVVECYEPLPKQ